MESLQKIAQIKPDVAIIGNDNLRPTIEYEKRYLKYLETKLYAVSLKQEAHEPLNATKAVMEKLKLPKSIAVIQLE